LDLMNGVHYLCPELDKDDHSYEETKGKRR
jgi:hypothetical protein